ncbi:MAG: hypothetical protein OXC44_05150 [Proteobacteria bacterium]|nr:hypothetical protein [Pseudomonadota bacterium]
MSTISANSLSSSYGCHIFLQSAKKLLFKLKFKLESVVIFFLLVSCTSNTHSPKTPVQQKRQPPSQTREQIVQRLPPEVFFRGRFFLQDPDCQLSQQQHSIENIHYRSWNGTQLQHLKSQTLSIQGSPYLSSHFISSTLLPSNLGLQCISTVIGISCKKKDISKTYPHMSICKKDALYPLDSFESIALTALVHLEKSYLHYLKARPSSYKTSPNTSPNIGPKKTLPKAKLYILPLITTSRSESHENVMHQHAFQDNLSYISHFFDGPAFLINPPNNPHVQLQDVELWQSPWALAHEFGHHLLTYHSDVSLTHIATSHPPEGTHHYITGLEAGLEENSLPTFSEEQKIYHSIQAWNGFNEAFADLWAYDTVGQNSHSLYGINCLETTRDVTSSLFGGGQSKTLTHANLQDVYKIHSDQPPSHSCQDGDFTKYHHLGASLAHGMYLLNKTTEHSQELGTKLIHLADSINTHFHQGTLSITVTELTALFIHHIINPPHELSTDDTEFSTELSTNPSAEQCHILNSHFPAMIDYWQEQKYFHCP